MTRTVYLPEENSIGIHPIPGTMFLSLLASGNDPLHSHLYGAALCMVTSDGSYEQTEWIFDRPQEEARIMNEIRDRLTGHSLYLCQAASILLPYLKEKLSFYGIQIPKESFCVFPQACEEEVILPYMENLYGFYYQYLLSGNPETLMPVQKALSNVLSSMIEKQIAKQIPGLTDGTFEITGLSRTETHLRYELLFSHPSSPAGDCIPNDLEKEEGGIHLFRKGPNAILLIPYQYTEFKYYLADYKQYYYLPDTDEAIHKSLAAFIDPKHRRRAKPETCYIRRQAYFLRQYIPVEKPVFRDSYESECYYLECSEGFFSSYDRQHAYLRSVIEKLCS